VREALDAIDRFSARFPEHARWIEEGYPNVTQYEHIARFGHPHPRAERRDASAR
jgi:hypothetical protein